MIKNVIELLVSAEHGSRELDAEIARSIGWSTRSLEVTDGKTGAVTVTKKTVWVDPDTEQPGKVPFYTVDLQAAFELSIRLAPQRAGALVCEGKYTRVSLGGPPIYHGSPAIALCVAALQIFDEFTFQQLPPLSSEARHP